MSTNWELYSAGSVGLGRYFNQSGLLFNTLGIPFGGVYVSSWTLQTTGQ